jgi:hypothetical protein
MLNIFGMKVSSNGSSTVNNNNTNTETKIILHEISLLIEKYRDIPYDE